MHPQPFLDPSIRRVRTVHCAAMAARKHDSSNKGSAAKKAKSSPPPEHLSVAKQLLHPKSSPVDPFASAESWKAKVVAESRAYYAQRQDPWFRSLFGQVARCRADPLVNDFVLANPVPEGKTPWICNPKEYLQKFETWKDTSSKSVVDQIQMEVEKAKMHPRFPEYAGGVMDRPSDTMTSDSCWEWGMKEFHPAEDLQHFKDWLATHEESIEATAQTMQGTVTTDVTLTGQEKSSPAVPLPEEIAPTLISGSYKAHVFQLGAWAKKVQRKRAMAARAMKASFKLHKKPRHHSRAKAAKNTKVEPEPGQALAEAETLPGDVKVPPPQQTLAIPATLLDESLALVPEAPQVPSDTAAVPQDVEEPLRADAPQVTAKEVEEKTHLALTPEAPQVPSDIAAVPHDVEEPLRADAPQVMEKEVKEKTEKTHVETEATPPSAEDTKQETAHEKQLEPPHDSLQSEGPVAAGTAAVPEQEGEPVNMQKEHGEPSESAEDKKGLTQVATQVVAYDSDDVSQALRQLAASVAASISVCHEFGKCGRSIVGIQGEDGMPVLDVHGRCDVDLAKAYLSRLLQDYWRKPHHDSMYENFAKAGNDRQ